MVRVLIGGAGLLLLAVAACLRIGQPISVQAITFHLLSEGFLAGHAGPGILGQLEEGFTSGESGSRLFFAFVAVLPRFVLVGKDELLYSLNENIENAAPLGAASVIAETYLQGGLGVHVIIWSVVGALFGAISKRLSAISADIQHSKISFEAIVYVCIMSVAILHMRDGMIPAVKLTLQALLVWIAVLVIPSRGLLASLVGHAKRRNCGPHSSSTSARFSCNE